MLPAMGKFADLLSHYPRPIALLAGGVSATGFAPLNLEPLMLLALALLMHLVATAASILRAAQLGWLFGLGLFAISNNWVATAFTYQSAMPAWLGWMAVLIGAFYLAMYPAMACGAAWWIAKKSRGSTAGITLSFILAFAGCWIVSEWLRSWWFTGFAWNPISAAALADNGQPLMIRWLGSYGASGLMLFNVGMLIWTWLALRRQSIEKWNGSKITHVMAWLFAPMLWFSPQLLLHQYSETDWVSRPAAIAITVVQPNISQIEKHSPGYEAISFSRLTQNSRPKGEQPRLVFWPESAVPWWIESGYPPFVYYDQPGDTAEGSRQALVRALGPKDILLTGADRLEFGKSGDVEGARNAVMAINAKGDIVAAYNKAHLVPFGEYLALRWLLEPLGAARLVPGTIDFWPGTGPNTDILRFDGGTVKVATQICYEIIFSGRVVDQKRRPDFIFNPSNDAWFGQWGPPQHLAQARLRAIEEGLPIVRSTPTGISAIIDANGHVIQSLPWRKAGRIDGNVPVAKAPTLFARHGNILPLSFAVLLLALAFFPLARRNISR